VGIRTDAEEETEAPSEVLRVHEPAPRKLRVVLADDHRRVRAGLRQLLEAEPDFEVVGEADDGLLALQLARRYKPDILLLDHEMPGLRGLDVARAVHRDLPSVRVVMFTFDETVRSLAAASGVSQFLTKDASNGRLASTLRYVAHGVTTPAPARPLVSLSTNGKPVEQAPEQPRPAPKRRSRQALLLFPTFAAAAVLAYVAVRVALYGAVEGAVDAIELAIAVVVAELLAGYAYLSVRRVDKATAETDRKTSELEQIARAVSLYNAPLDLSATVERFLGQIRGCIGDEATAALILYDSGLRTFEPIAEIGPNAGAFKRDVYPLVVLPHEIFEDLVVQQRNWLVNDTTPPSETWKTITNFFPRLKARTIVAIPLRSRGTNLGAVFVRHPAPAAISAEQLAQIEVLCHFIAGAVHTATLQFRAPEVPAPAH
jgi:DNA-binding NarL/FixJ family response regulator